MHVISFKADEDSDSLAFVYVRKKKPLGKRNILEYVIVKAKWLNNYKKCFGVRWRKKPAYLLVFVC